MMPEEWPVSAPAAEPPSDRRAPPRRDGRGRLATVRSDFFLDSAERLTEQERALMTTMLNRLVGDVAAALRAALPAGWAGANDGGDYRLVRRLTNSGLLDDEALLALLLRRAEEESIAIAARSRAGRSQPRAIQGLVSHGNGPAAASAMALVLARGRRRDGIGQCLLTFDDVPPPAARKLTRRVAAVLRSNLIAIHGPAATDEALIRAAADVTESNDPERSLDALTRELVALLDSGGFLDDRLLLAAAAEGEIAFLAHALARRSGVHGAVAAHELLSRDPARVMALLRVSGAAREFAAGLIAGSGDLMALDSDGRALEYFDGMTAADIASARSWLLADDDYRAALGRLEGDRG
ncbi:MAG: DUF2336 domain-containing protein [Sphingomicrobium sp.]